MIRFIERDYPSANGVLLTGPRPVLVDTGFGSDADLLLKLLAATPPALIVNTHFHSDHVGGNRAVQDRFGAPIAASGIEAGLVNRGDPAACEAAWLRQPIERYRVDRSLDDGDVVETGAGDWQVIATPGHTEGHLSLFCAEAGIVVLGDALHHADVGWLSPLRPAALDQSAATLERIAGLGAVVGYSGHGPAVTDMAGALGRARRRVEGWRRDPEAIGWHACKRIFAHALMLEDGLAEDRVADALLGWPWFRDHARIVFGVAPANFVQPLLREMVRADAAYWQGGVLRARAGYRVAPPGWSVRTPLPA